MNFDDKIYIAGHTGMVGSAILRNLQEAGYKNLIGKPIEELDLTNQHDVEEFFGQEKPDYVILAAAKVGGIVANSKYRAQFIYENLMIQNNIIHQSYLHGIKKLLFLGSSCIYPKACPQPINEEYLLTSDLEYTNEPYALAKIAGLKLCENYNIQYGTDFISLMPTNLYGPKDNFNLETSHVLPALIRRMHLGKCLQSSDLEGIRHDLMKRPIETVDGKAGPSEIINILNRYGIILDHDKSIVSVKLWGTGNPRREFLHVDDLAFTCISIMKNVSAKNLVVNGSLKNSHLNIGSGTDHSIKDLAEMIKKIVDFKGEIAWDVSKPDGTFQKLLSSEKTNNYVKIRSRDLTVGINEVYRMYLNE